MKKENKEIKEVKMTGFKETLRKGTRIFYNGDMANEEGFGVITKQTTDKWGTHVNIKMDDGRTFPGLSITMFSEEYLGHRGTRFVTEEAYKRFRQATIDKIEAQLKEVKMKEERNATPYGAKVKVIQKAIREGKSFYLDTYVGKLKVLSIDSNGSWAMTGNVGQRSWMICSTEINRWYSEI